MPNAFPNNAQIVLRMLPPFFKNGTQVNLRWLQIGWAI